MGDFDTELTRWMEARGLGVRELHRRSGYSAAYISQLRHGRRMPSPEAARDLDDALGADGALAGSVSEPGHQPSGELAAVLAMFPQQPVTGALRDREYDHLVQSLAHWALQMKRRDLLAILGAAATAAYASPLLEKLTPDQTERVMLAAAGSSRADEAVVGHIATVLDHCMRQEDTLGPRIVLETVLAQHHVVRSLLADRPPDSIRVRLLSLLANISRFTGWVLFNLDDFGGAQYYYAQARSAAHEADDDAVCSLVLSNWSQLATWTGDPRLGVEHAVGAVAWGQRAGSKLLVSYACDVGARAYAGVVRRSSRGDRHADHARCMRSLDQAYRELSEAPDGDPGAALAYFYGDGQYLATRTGCLLDLDDPGSAVGLATQSRAVIDPSFVRNVALTRVFAARAHLQLRDIDAACGELSEAVPLTRHNTSLRLVSAIAGVRQELTPLEGSRAVAELDERLHAAQVIT
jgi:transcriptional regulator with XRE-family HTH domain